MHEMSIDMHELSFIKTGLECSITSTLAIAHTEMGTIEKQSLLHIIKELKMKPVFIPEAVGSLMLKNRIVHSAILEVMADENGIVSDQYINRYKRLAKGGVGLLITGGMYVHSQGKVNRLQAGIHSDDVIPELKRLSDTVHKEGGLIAFQLVHGGNLSSPDLVRTPVPDVTDIKPDEISSLIDLFAEASERAVKAGADAIQIHAAHGVLISQFLSPFFNQRTDGWGGNNENRFRFLKEIVEAVKKRIPEEFPVIVKLNGNDYTPEPGITPDIAAYYASQLEVLGVDAIEISGGTLQHSFMNMSRGTVPVDSMIQNLQGNARHKQKEVLDSINGLYDIEEAYHQTSASVIQPAVNKTKIILVGGNRNLDSMNAHIEKGYTDFIGIGRPFIREPYWVNRAMKGEASELKCSSCNECLAAILNEKPLKCYYKGN